MEAKRDCECPICGCDFCNCGFCYEEFEEVEKEKIIMNWKELNPRDKTVDFNELEGKVFTQVEFNISGPFDSDRILFVCDDGSMYLMFHDQQCCESVTLDDVVGGDLKDLIGHKILLAKESSNKGPEDDYTSSTWTFYTLRTINTTIVLRWYGESNGRYSEDVDLARIK